MPAALAKYAEASRLDPAHEGIQINYGIALLRLGRWSEGLDQLHAVWMKNPNNEQVKAALNDALKQAPENAQPLWRGEIR